MHKFISPIARLSASCAGVALAIPVMSAPAMAQNAATPKDIAEIIVTAQKRPEKLQDIAVAAAVLSQAAVAQAHVTDLSDINRVVPSVEIKGTFNGRVPYGMRGISTNANEGAIGLTSGVSIQMDGVPVPADSFAANTITDVAQLEVLKGPQATLGGRTASAGVINFVTFGPTAKAHYALDVSGTEDGEHRVSLRASGPISDTLSYSLAGYESRTPYPVTNIKTGVKSKADSFGVRGKLKFESGDFDATLMGHYALSKSRGNNFIYQYLTPGALLLGAPPLSQSVLFPGFTIAYGNTKYSSPVNMGSRYEDRDGSLVMNYRMGDFTLTSTTSHFYEKQFQTQDLFGTDIYFFNVLTGGMAPAFDNMQSNAGFVRQTTQEFKLASDSSKAFSYILGAFYSDSNVTGDGLRTFVGFPAAQRNISTTKNYAIYAHATEKFSDKIWAVGGLRYNWDKIGWNLAQYFDPTKAQYGSGNFGAGGFAWNASDSSSALVGDFALQYHPAERVMAYASYTRGYKPNAFNTAHTFSVSQTAALAAPTVAANASDLSFTKATKQEHIDSFELGLKSSLLDRHLTLNLAAFYTNYQNYQAQVFDNSKLVGVLVLANAGARTQGIEADATYVKGNSRISLSAALIDAKFKNFKGANCYALQTVAQGCVADASGNYSQDLSGKSMPASPKFKASASITQTIPLEKFDVVLGSNLNYRSSTVLQANQNPYTRQGAFALLDLSVGFQTKDEIASLTFFVNNVTNRFYLTNAEDFFSGPYAGTANAVIGQPARDSHRYAGARLSVKI
jgi:iron complex outermembrane receptor protein